MTTILASICDNNCYPYSMNFLAHIYLSGDNPKIMVGNFIGDFVKGRKALDQYEPEIARGIALHRTIDLYTDTHAIVNASKKRLSPIYRHYSGVIVDMFYDHFLARYWHNYHSAILSDFAQQVYVTIKEHQNILPDKANYLLTYMIKGDWLTNYAHLSGIQRALTGMAKRTTYNSKMEEAVHDLQQDYDEYKNEFDKFFPEVRQYVKEWLAIR